MHFLGNKIVSKSKKFDDLIEKVKAVAPTRANVLILGESGTGKELFAKLIHEMSHRKDKKMVALNCAALPETLVESELFGFEKGSFTGSISTKHGKFEKASGSTILLDEISEMGFHMQAKLLRVVQESELNRIGSNDTINLDLRIIATSNKNLIEEVKKGNFREDLYYRLNVVMLNIPPLRNRPEDIIPLTNYFISSFNQTYNKNISRIEDKVYKLLLNYSYPGNVRELKNIIERAVLFSKNFLLEAKDIEFENKSKIVNDGMILKHGERETIIRVLESVGQNRTRAAEKLGISVRTLRNKLKNYRQEGVMEI